MVLTEALIAPGVTRGLGDLPFHADGPLVRWLMAGADVLPEARTHVAVHRFDAVPAARRDYCEPHVHTVPELNLVLPVDALRVEIVLGEERHDVEGPASIFIPPGLAHSANVLRGTGFFVAILLGVGAYEDAFAA